MTDAKTEPKNTRRLGIMCEPTPNPNSLKFKLDDRLNCERSANFPDAASAHSNSALAEALFANHPDVRGVFLTPDWLSLLKSDQADWQKLAFDVAKTIRTHYASGERTISDSYQPPQVDTTGIESRIKEILDEVRPMVQMDGGDIVFAGYEAGVVKVHMQGSCSGCPSSTATLRMGIQRRLQEAIPEIIEVVPIAS